MQYAEYYVQFFTATILEWKQLLKKDQYKDIIVESLRYLVKEQRVKVYAFVIMSNHLHVMWQVQPGNKQEQVQRDFLKFTAQQIKSDLSVHHPNVLEHFYVNAADRKYQIWERSSAAPACSGGGLYAHQPSGYKKPCIAAGLKNPISEYKLYMGLWITYTCFNYFVWK